MLNFNSIDNPNSFTHPIPLHGGNFSDSPTSMVTSAPSTQSVPAQTQQINLSYLSANTSTADQTNWTESVLNASNSTIDNNNLPNSNGSVRIQHQKDYIQTIITPESDVRSNLNIGNYLQQKGSENVKRFSVNNLLQLANNCRALVDERRLSSGK